jgi:hypothetical protein
MGEVCQILILRLSLYLACMAQGAWVVSLRGVGGSFGITEGISGAWHGISYVCLLSS